MVTINTRLSAGEVEYIIEHSKSRMVFVDHELEDLLEGVDESVERIRIDDTGEEGDPYEDYLAEGSAEPGRAYWRTRRRLSPSTTPPGPRGARRVSCIPIAART
jgi:long-subunit acyl-CoA synthetase (AMP-forming)